MADAPTGRKLASAVQRIFAAQSVQSERGKTNFDTANWNRKLAQAIEPELLKLYLQSAKTERTADTPEQKLANALVVMARVDAEVLALQLNTTTSEWLDSGRDPEQVFGVDRAAGIGLTQGARAFNATRSQVGKLAKHKKKKWIIDPATACVECKSLSNKVVAIDKNFRSKGGLEAMFAPLHPNCYCKVETF